MVEAKGTIIWGLYENHPGKHGKLVGLFSSVDKARDCALIQPLLLSNWQRRDVGYGSLIWRAEAIDLEQSEVKVFAFTVEEIKVDRLVEPA